MNHSNDLKKNVCLAGEIEFLKSSASTAQHSTAKNCACVTTLEFNMILNVVFFSFVLFINLYLAYAIYRIN